MNTLPPELILHITSFLPLKSLIAARGVDTRWRRYSQIAPIHPARKTLLDLYLAAIVHPKFRGIRALLLPHLRDFDREAYLAHLVSHGCILPDDFELWVLEWPSKAIYFWAWPGLPDLVTPEDKRYPWGYNLLGTNPPTLDIIRVPRNYITEEGGTCKGLGLWSGGVVWACLVVGGNEKLNNRRTGQILWSKPGSLWSPPWGTPDGLLILSDPLPFDDSFTGWLREQMEWDQRGVDKIMEEISEEGEWEEWS